MADVAADVDGEVTTDGARGRGSGVGGAENGWCYVRNGKNSMLGGFDLLRPVLTASRPSQTMAQMGPESMSVKGDQSRSFRKWLIRGAYTQSGR